MNVSKLQDYKYKKNTESKGSANKWMRGPHSDNQAERCNFRC
jgi:hypothetical protein